MPVDPRGINPYRPMDVASGVSDLRADHEFLSAGPLWMAYAIAPLMIPLYVVGLVILAMLVSGIFGFEITTGILVLPILAVLGAVVSYVVWGVIGMPIVFLLRRLKWLRARNLHLSAFGLVALIGSPTVLSLAARAAQHGSDPAIQAETVSTLVRSLCFQSLFALAPALISTSTFWHLANRFQRNQETPSEQPPA